MDEILTPQESPSMEDTIRETLHSLTNGEPLTDEPDVVEDQPEADRPGRVRDESGRFAKTAEEVAAEAEQPAEEAEAAPSEPEKLPRWRKDELQHWTTLPEQVKAAVLRREEDIHRGIQQYKTEAEFGASLRSVLDEKRTAELTTYYGGVREGIGQLFQLSDYAAQDPAGFIQWFAQQRGIDLGNIGQAQTPPSESEALRIARQTEQRIAQWERQQQDQRLNGTVEQIQKFQQEHDKAGYLDDWNETPSGLQPGAFTQRFIHALKTGEARSPAEAYEYAKRNTPEVYAAEVARLQSEAAEKARKELAKQQAKRASSVNTQPRGSLPPVEPVGTIEDTIRNTYRNLMQA